MKIIQRYILKQMLRALMICLGVFVLLFLIFDFFDRIDNVLGEGVGAVLIFQYFVFKVPLMLALMLPVSMMVAVLFSIGLLSRNSEIIAMRAAGIPVRMLIYPIIMVGLAASVCGFILSEFVVPYTQRRSREIYNLDIKKKDETGTYSQSDFWWRSGDTFYSAETFDSRTNSFHKLAAYQINRDFQVLRRSDAKRVDWLDKVLGWNMHSVVQYYFKPDSQGGASGRIENVQVSKFPALPLPLKEQPSDFYDVAADPNSMGLMQLRKFISKQANTGISVAGYLPYVYEKISFPFSSVIVALVVFPFALRPARAGGMALAILAALVIGFSYYAVHSFSVAMGKAELIPPILSAWMANLLLGFVAAVLLIGAESPG